MSFSEFARYYLVLQNVAEMLAAYEMEMRYD